MKTFTLSFYMVVLFSIPSKSQNLARYYKNIYAAENYLCDSNYKSACSLYREAFKEYIILYPDLRNAFKAALLSKKEKEINFFWKLVKQHPDLVYQLKANNVVMDKIPEHILKQVLSYQSIRPRTNLENVLDSIRDVDQAARKSCPGNMNKTCQNIFYKVDSTNIKFVANLLGRTGYSESIKGEESLGTVFLIGLHARRWGFTDLDSILYRYVKTGLIKPTYLAQLVSYRSDLDSINKCCLNKNVALGYGATTWVVGHHLIEFNQYDTTLNKINKNRVDFLMDDVKRDVNKQYLVLSNDLFKNHGRDFNLELFSMSATEEEFKAIVDELNTKKVVKKLWL